MACTVDIISLGTLSRNIFWNEQGKVRPAHATTTLVRDGSHAILVDPSVPAELMAQRLRERTGLEPSAVNAVFLTSFLPVHRRALELFDHATWLIGPDERAAVISHLQAALDEMGDGSEGAISAPDEIRGELALIQRTQPAQDRLTPSVHLYPSPGVTVGSASLLVAAMKTVVIAGDAILTREHFDHGRVYDRSVDPEAARQSFADILEVADIVVPGHDNLIVVA